MSLNLLRILLLLSLVYVAGAALSFARNDFDLQKNVGRYSEEQCPSPCLTTTDIRTTTDLTWVGWSYMSDEKGSDVTTYFPFDGIALLTIVGLFAIGKHLKVRKP